MPNKKTKKKLPSDFESAMQALESLVTQMEEGKMTLEESLNAFEEGVQLTRICQKILKQAEQRVIELSPDGAEAIFNQAGE